MQGWDFENTSLVILGAGFSRAATDGGTPLMQGYFDRLDPNKRPDLYAFVLENGCNQSCQTVADASVEEVLQTLEQVRTAGRRVLAGWFDEWKDKVPQIRRQLADYTLSRLVDDVSFGPENWAVNLLRSTGFQTTFISMNYDNIAETILSKRGGTTHCHGGNCPHCKMQQLLSYACNCSGRTDAIGTLWKGALIKPHGSIAWSRCVNPECRLVECIIPKCDCNPARDVVCSTCKQPHDLAMVFPTMSKNLNELQEIATMWQAANSSASEAESILFFGFSLPPSDALFGRLIQQACKQRQIRRIGVIDRKPEAVVHNLRKLLSSADPIEIVELNVPDTGIPDWYNIREGIFEECDAD